MAVVGTAAALLIVVVIADSAGDFTVFGSLEIAIPPSQNEAAITVVRRLPEDGICPAICLGLEDVLKI